MSPSIFHAVTALNSANWVRLGAVALLGLSAMACSSAPQPESKPLVPASKGLPATATSATSASALYAQIQAEVGDAACDSVKQCKTIAVGNKSCGGPEAYLAWSTQRSNAAKLEGLVAQYTAQRTADNQRAGAISNCAMVMDPGATCQAGKCVLQSGGSGAASAK